MARFENRGNREISHSTGSDFGFLVGAAIVAIALILVSVALGVGINPDTALFAAP